MKNIQTVKETGISLIRVMEKNEGKELFLIRRETKRMVKFLMEGGSTRTGRIRRLRNGGDRYL